MFLNVSVRRVFVTVMFFSIVIFLSPIKGFSLENRGPSLEKKTIKRWIDPVMVGGSLLNNIVEVPLSNLRLYAYQGGKFEPIRYQIDEMTEDGDWILPDAWLPNGDLSNGKFDTWDKLLFMVNDTGDRVTKDVWPSGYTKGEEIEVVDPLTGEKGWCYLLYFTSNPPARSALPDYVQYKYETSLIETDYWGSLNIITKDGRQSTYYLSQWATKNSGGSGKNYVDRLKIRVRAKMLFGSVTLKFDEEGLKSDVLAYKKGPIRMTRRLEQYVVVPGGFKALRVVLDVSHYRCRTTVPSMFRMPFRLNKVLSEAVIRFGTDYCEEVIGSKVYNSCNPQGFLVDGKMDDGEKDFDPGVDKWRLISGEFGTFMTRTLFTPEILEHIKITEGFIDDITQKSPPERFSGTIGYLWQDWNIGGLPKGEYYLFLDFYYMPPYKPGNEVQYVNCQDHPIKIRVGNQEKVNNALILPKLGEKYQEIQKKPKDARLNCNVCGG